MAATKAKSSAPPISKTLLHGPAVDRLKQGVLDYAYARATGLVQGLEDKLGSITEHLDQASGGAAESAVKAGAAEFAAGKNPAKAGISALVEGAKEKVRSVVGQGGGAAPRMTNIIEEIDIGLPVSTVYDQWTQYQEFPTFMKGVESVDPGEGTETTWRLKVFKSRRTLTATTTEQIPDRRIAWTSDGAKGTTKGVVTFHPLADDLTRVLLVVEYYPGGFFEKTGNLWRAPGRRLRLDLKHFRRFVTIRGEATGAWRGEIRDSEITTTHNDTEAENDENQQTSKADSDVPDR